MECGKYHIKAQVRNLLTEGDWEIFLHPHSNGEAYVEVFCEFDPDQLLIETFPVKQTPYRNLFISKTRPLILNVHVTVGSFLIFDIHWGDGLFDTYNQSDKLVPERITGKHLFNITGTYNITLQITSPTGSQTILIQTLDVQICGPPLVIYNLGDIDDAELIPFSHDIMATGVWIVGDNCTDQIQPYFGAVNWNLTYRENGSFVNQYTPTNTGMEKKITKLRLKKGTVPVGRYRLELKVSWTGDVPHSESYFGYFDIVLSKLSIRIVNGIEATIPYQTRSKANGGLAAFFGFNMDAGISFDPNNEKAGYNGMQFKWECKRLATQEEFMDSLLHRLENHREQETAYIREIAYTAAANMTIANNLTCSEDEWEDLTDSRNEGSLVKLHTINLLEGISYLFKVTVVKGELQGDTFQKLNVLAGATPLVKIT